MDCCTCSLSPIDGYRARSIDIGITEEALDLNLSMARENGAQEANLNSGYHCDPQELNFLHPFWKETNLDEVVPRSPPTSGEKRISFGEKVKKKVGWDSSGVSKVCEEETDFVERGDRALCKVVKIVEATIESSSGTIIPILLGVKDKTLLQEMDTILSDVVGTLEAGKPYRFSNSSSLRIRPNSHALNLISRAHVVFQYFAGFPPEKLDTRAWRNTADVAGNPPTAIHITKIQKVDKPKLARQASRSIYCTHPDQ